MRREQLGELTVCMTGGTDGNGGGDGPAVVMLHGFGAPGEDLVPLADYLGAPPNTRFFFPAAPIKLPAFFGGDSRAWWMIDIERRMQQMAAGRQDELMEEVPAGIAEANALVNAALDDLVERFGVDPGKTVLGGFSQGAMLSLDVALRSDRPFAGLVLMSGTLLCASEWTPAMSKRSGMLCLLSHGRQDELLPFSASARLRELLINAGWCVEWVAFDGGHEIPPPVLAGAADVIQRAIG